ncbi:RAD51-associated protein 1 isoform X2 [Dipodomys spectabilis]|nr:RAD51-associated protein 1 isoform X2 [Dipodomys spectabilis]
MEDSDSDDDFMPTSVPLNKKSQARLKEPTQESPKTKLKNLQKESIPLQEKTPKKRVPLDDKIFQRGLEAALALSAKQLPTVNGDVPASRGQSVGKHGGSEADTMRESPIGSGCRVASDASDLDRTMGEGDGHAPGVRGKRKAACAAAAQQRKVLEEDSSGDSPEASSGSDGPAGEEGEDSDFSESKDTDEDFTVTKSKVKAMKMKEMKVEPPPEKKEKKTKPKCSTWGTSMASSPAAVKLESQPSPSKVALSSKAPRTPAQRRSPAAERRRPTWVPPAPSGNSSSRETGGSAPPPSHSLRLGLSRLARVKPLHPSAASSHPW